MGTVLIGMAAGFGVGLALGFGAASTQAAIVASLTLSAGGSGRLRTALPVAAILGLIVVIYSTVGALTTGYPWAAALAMAAVAFSTSVMTAAKPVGLLIGMVASQAYFLVTGVGVLAHEAIGSDLGQVGLLGLVGLLTGLALVVVRALIEQAIGLAPPAVKSDERPQLLAPMVESVRSFDHTAKDGVRRAIALGLAMLIFQLQADHNAFWVMLTVFVILQPNGRSTVTSAIIRVVGTLAGVLVVLAATLVLPKELDLPLGLLGIAASLALSTRSSWLSAAFGAAAAAVFVGLPNDDIAAYAGSRLIDTLIGAVIALSAGYLLWPRTKPGGDDVPSDLAASASGAGINGV
jgi:hypothetical protein